MGEVTISNSDYRVSVPHRVARGKLHGIQLLRAVAALLVALFHAHQAFATRFGGTLLDREEYLLAFGAVGVHIFFVISGFIMVYTSRFEDGFDSVRFFRRRLIRIYPIYWICVALYLIGYTLLGSELDLTVSDTIGALLLLPGDAAEIIGPAWTLAFEMFFYLAFGLAMMLGLERGLILLSAVFGGSILFGAVFDLQHPALVLATSPLLLEFIAGSLIGYLLVTDRIPRGGGYLLIALSVVLFIAGIAYGYDRLPGVVVWGVPSVLLVAGLIMVEQKRGAGEVMRKLGHFGDSSYALYLIHILVIAFSIAAARSVPALQGLPPLLIMIPIALFSLVLGEILHHWVERPLLGRLQKRPTNGVGPKSVEGESQA